jgi:hypothetical protein
LLLLLLLRVPQRRQAAAANQRADAHRPARDVCICVHAAAITALEGLRQARLNGLSYGVRLLTPARRPKAGDVSF